MKALIFDTETTGLLYSKLIPLNRQPHIIEFYGAIVDLDKGKIESEYESLFRPPIKITDEITKITHIDNDMVVNAPAFAESADAIKKMFEDAPIVIAHNCSFDKEMIELEFSRLDQQINWKRLICSVEATIHIKGFRLKLKELHEHLFGAEFEDAHRAKADTRALIKCCIELRKRGLL